jgi:predicted phage terminase large subunit-like protein
MKRHDPHRHAALQDELLTREATKRLRVFLELAWPILEPAAPFLPNWHIDLLCEYLEAVTAGQITRLVINMPPRYGKSQLVSVMWPVWEWLHRPSRKWLFASYSEALAYKHSQDRRRILRDSWFQQRWGGVRLTREQQAKAEIQNTRRGVMAAVSMGGAVTGRGGNRLVIDDPHSPEQAESDVLRQQALTRFAQHLATRIDDKAHDAIIVVMQRLHEEDVTALCLELDYEHLCLPAYEPAPRTIVFPMSGRRFERQPDEPLWPAREGPAELAELRRTLGSHAFSAQYLQQPVPRVGGYFPREWWNRYDVPPTEGQVVQSWDLSFKDGPGSDYVVGLVARRVGADVYLLGRHKSKASFTETLRAIREMLERYPETSAVLVESAANGEAVVDALKREVRGLIPVLPRGGKTARANAVGPWVQARQVYLPRTTTATGLIRPEHAWAVDFEDNCAAFPKGAHDDDVDAFTQLLVWLMEHSTAEPASAMRPPEPILPTRPKIPSVFPRRRPW